MERHVESNDPWFAAAAKRLKVITVNQDTFSADVVYHQKCYNKFTEEYEKIAKKKPEINDEQVGAERKFLSPFKSKVINQKCCYLLRELVVELNNLYEYFDSSQESSAKSLKKFIANSFGNQVCFTPAVGLRGSIW